MPTQVIHLSLNLQSERLGYTENQKETLKPHLNKSKAIDSLHNFIVINLKVYMNFKNKIAV